MITGALQVGVPVTDFWRMTLRQLAWHHRASRARSDTRMSEQYALAALNHISRCGKRLPSLDEFLGRKKKPKIIGNAHDFMRHFAQSYSNGKVVRKDAVKEAVNG